MRLDKQTTNLRTAQLGFATVLISAATNVVTAATALAKAAYQAAHATPVESAPDHSIVSDVAEATIDITVKVMETIT